MLIVSAKHGLIAAQHEIDYYDCRLAEVSVDSLRPTVLDEASRVLSSQHWQSVGVCASKDYLEVLAGLIEALPHGVSLDVLGGGQGKRLTAVRNWLHQGRAQSAP